MPKYGSIEELNLKHQEVLKIVDTWPEEKKKSYLPIIEEKYQQHLKELTQRQNVNTLKNLRTEAGIKKLKPPESVLRQKQLEADQKKFDEYTKKYQGQSNIVTQTYKDDVAKNSGYTFEPDIRESAIGKRNEMADSLRLWYEWDALRKKGIDISLNDLREYKKVQEKEKYSLLQPSINQMKARGFSEKTINMFAINYTNFVNKGDDPQTALSKSYQLTKITLPTDFIMRKGK